MTANKPSAQDWIDGFLIVGNQPALDLLNTKLIDAGTTVDLLPDVAALGRWFLASGLVSSPPAREFVSRWAGDPRAQRFLRDVLAYRERLRAVVLKLEGGQTPGRTFVRELNHLLQVYPARVALVSKAGVLKQETLFAPSAPADFWVPIAAASATLLSKTDLSRVRKCQTCVVHFYDISKKSYRRWCSMNMCGNKVKVAAYQQRRRELLK